MYKNIIVLTILFTSVFLFGFGCKGLSKEQQQLIKPVTLNYWTVFNDVKELQRMADEYKLRRPYVTVKVRQVRYEEFDQLFTNALADDVGPDIVSMNVRWIGEHEQRLMPMPASVTVANVQTKGTYIQETLVTPETVAMPTLRAIQEKFVSTVAEDIVIGKNMYGLPLALDTMALYYNKDLLDQAGVPEAPKTWSDFLDAVKKSTKFDASGNIVQSGVAMGTGNNIDNAGDLVALLMMQNGRDMTEGKSVIFASGIGNAATNHPAMQAASFYTSFARPTLESYSWNETQENALTSFTRGKSVFYFGFAYDLPRIQAQAPQMNLEIVSVPQLRSDAPKNVANYWIESVVKKSKNPNEAWDFIRFMVSSQNIAAYTKATNRPTPLREQIAAQREDVRLAPFVDSVLVAKNWYRGKDYEPANQAIRSMVDNLLKPVPENQDEARAHATIINNAARVVQQTM